MLDDACSLRLVHLSYYLISIFVRELQPMRILFDLYKFLLNGLPEHVESHPKVSTQLVYLHRHEVHSLLSQKI